MGIKRNVKRCIWLTLVILMSWVLILEGKAVVDTILAHPDLTVRKPGTMSCPCCARQKRFTRRMRTFCSC